MLIVANHYLSSVLCLCLLLNCFCCNVTLMCSDSIKNFLFSFIRSQPSQQSGGGQGSLLAQVSEIYDMVNALIRNQGITFPDTVVVPCNRVDTFIKFQANERQLQQEANQNQLLGLFVFFIFFFVF